MQDTKYRRIVVTRQGYAVVPGATDKEALENAKSFSASDFDWEPVNEELINDTAEVIEPCGPSGEVI